MARIEPTDEDLQLAWRILYCPAWPGTLAETLTDPIRSRLVRMYAQQLARSRRVVCTAPRPAPIHRPIAYQIDRKRAAAGDVDD